MSPSRAIGLVGAGGLARAVMPLVQQQTVGEASATVCFVESEPAQSVVNGIPCLSEREFMALPCENHYFNVAVGDSRVRQRLADSLQARGAEPLEIRNSNAQVFHGNDIGPGALLCGFTTITSNIRIGCFFQLNIYSYVGHDCVIGDYVTFGPRVSCNGNVHVGDHAYIGTGAVIRNGTPDRPLTIGEGAVVGMGAVVTKDVPPGVTVIGNPARPVPPR